MERTRFALCCYISFGPLMRQRLLLIQKFVVFLLLVDALHLSAAFGFDSANSCSPNGKLSRRGRVQMLAAIPCDLTRQAYCNLPGSAYPWNAVRRFVHENQGLMKRMYGDVRHISILRDEIQNNEIDIEDVEMAAERYSRDGFRRISKYMHNSEFGTSKNNDVLMEPHFRPVSTTAPPTTTTTTTATKRTETNYFPTTTTITTSPEKNQRNDVTQEPPASGSDLRGKNETSSNDSPRDRENFRRKETATAPMTESTQYENVENSVQANGNKLDSEKLSTGDSNETDDDENIVSDSVFEAPSTSSPSNILTGENIQIIESPQLGLNNITESATISTTLKAVTTAKTKINGSSKQQQSQKQQQKSEQQPQRQQVISTVLKESSNIKPNFNESERFPAADTEETVKGAETTLRRDNNYNGQSNKNNEYHNAPTEPTKSLSSSTPTTLLLSSTSKSSADLLSGEKLRKPIQHSPATTATTVTKPVLRDGQLFQDTMKQEAPPVVNMRGVNACPVKEEVVAPFWANNTRGEVLALLNLYPFEQYVHWEKCTHEHRQMYCRDGCRCEQQYRLHRLLAYDPHNECRGIFSDWFRFPSCCICKCYDIPLDFRATSRSPRSDGRSDYRHPIETAEEEVKKAIYGHAADEWYRPREDFDTYKG